MRVAGKFIGGVNAGVIRFECGLSIDLVFGVDGASASAAAGVVSSTEWNEGWYWMTGFEIVGGDGIGFGMKLYRVTLLDPLTLTA